MHRLGAAADCRLLDLDEISHDRLFIQPCTHTQMCKRTDGTVIRDHRVNDETVILYRDAVAELRIADARSLMQFTGVADRRAAFDMNVGMKHAVAPDLRFAANVGVGRIEKGHSGLEHQSPHRAATQEVFELTQLSASVDAGNLTNVRVLKQCDPFAAALENSGNVRQIVFALTV